MCTSLEPEQIFIFSTPYGLTAITISVAPWAPVGWIILASSIIKIREQSILPAQRKSCPRLPGICFTLQTPRLLHLVIHPDGNIWTVDMVESPGLRSLRQRSMLLPVASLQRKPGAEKKQGEDPMRLSLASSALAAAFVLTPVAAGYAPALCQDFSITNPAEPANAWRRDMMRQLQAWWDVHAYYPRHASNKDQGGTVKLHLVILPDGRIWMVDVVDSSESARSTRQASRRSGMGSCGRFPRASRTPM